MSEPTTPNDRLVLVTGASRGIGRAAAEAFAADGARVIAVARNAASLEDMDDQFLAAGWLRPTLVPLDINDGPGVDRLAAAIYERWVCLDVLVGNAATLGPLSPLTHFKPKDWDQVINTNLTANWRLIRSFDPLLQAADAGRALFLTSGAATKSRPYWGAYAASKIALETLVKTYAGEVSNISQVKANLLDPGATRTAMREEAMPGEDPNTLPPAEAVAPLILEMCARDYRETGQVVRYRDWATTQ
ncbi:MAG: SDR family NAD(P)-dependent oxidoreductase [Pseudomonadota bacterium]